MEHTALDITAGDLSLRLPDTDPHTETGRLGTVLNDMLDRLQQALRQRGSRKPGCAASSPTPATNFVRPSPPSRASPNSPYVTRTAPPPNAGKATNRSPRTPSA